MKVLITGKLPAVAEKLLKKHKLDVQVHDSDKPISKSKLLKLGKDTDAILSLLTDKFNAEVINRLDRCKIISNYAVGFNNINIKAAKKKNIVVTNTPDILTDATADLALALLLACARRIVESDNFTRKNKFEGWKPQLMLGVELRGKTLGIIGAGRIGQATARRAKAFGLKIVYSNRSRKVEFEDETGARKLPVSQLLRKSHIVSLHIPLTEKTFHLLDTRKLDLLRSDAILINTARGEVVDEKHLIGMLKTGKIFSAGFDVYENEPEINKELYKLKNVVLLPHIGSATVETRNKMAELAAQNIINVLNGKEPVTPVN